MQPLSPKPCNLIQSLVSEPQECVLLARAPVHVELILTDTEDSDLCSCSSEVSDVEAGVFPPSPGCL